MAMLTRRLKLATSSSVKVSALAMIGIKLTLVCNLRMNSISICFRLEDNISSRISRERRDDVRMAGWLDEVQAGMDTVVDHLLSVDPVLLLEVGIEPSLDVLHNWLPALIVVHKVTETGGIHNSQAETNTALLDIWRKQTTLEQLRAGSSNCGTNQH